MLQITNEIYLNVIHNILNSWDNYTPKVVDTFFRIIEFGAIGYLMWYYRPRKEWPEFFSLGVD